MRAALPLHALILRAGANGMGYRGGAAGADIKEMAPRSFPDTYSKNMFSQWAELTQIKKPVRA